MRNSFISYLLFRNPFDKTNIKYQMKRKFKFVSPKVTRAVPLYPETDMMQIIPGSTMYDQTVVSTGIGVENYDGESYLEYE